MRHYYPFSIFLKSKLGFPVQKISVDAGFNCPNRDGTKGTGGCSFCSNEAFAPSVLLRGKNLEEQILAGIQKIKFRKKINHFMVYFQPYSNTYGTPEYLRKCWDFALAIPEIVGVAVGTRPDCLGDEVLELIEEYAQKTHFWLEIGLETMHNETLKRINRGHSFEEFLLSYHKARKIKNLYLCVHLIHGLPGETKEMMLNTVKTISTLKPDAVKFHQLEIVKGTKLEKEYQQNLFKLLSVDEYLELLGESLELLDKKIVVQRLFGFTPNEYLIAPKLENKAHIGQMAEKYLKEKNIFQGSKAL